MLNNALVVGFLVLLKIFSGPKPDMLPQDQPRKTVDQPSEIFMAIADFEVSTTITCTNKNIQVTYTGDADDNASFSWSFGGASIVSGSGKGPYVIRWPTTGSKTVVLTVTQQGEAFTNVKTVNVMTNITTSLTRSICSGETVTLGTRVLDKTGTYTETFTSPTTGCDSIVTLNLTVNPTFQRQINEEICQGEVYVFGNDRLSRAGTFTKTFSSTNGCDSVVTLTLAVNPTFTTQSSLSICQGENHKFGSQTLTTSGTYQEVFTSLEGCDSTVTLQLTVFPTFDEAISETICEGESYIFGDETLTNSGTFTKTFTSVNDCDSTVTLRLKVAPNYSRAINEIICDNEDFMLGTESFTETGTYVKEFLTVDGCDSVITLNLTVFPTYEIDTTIAICDGESYVFGNEKMSKAGMFTKTFSTRNGCDSTINLTLEVLPIYNQTDTVSICEGEFYLFDTDTLTMDGLFTKTFQSVDGCDSTVNIQFNVIPNIRDSIPVNICEGESYLFGEEELNRSGTYMQSFTSSLGCDSTVVIMLVVNEIYNENIRVEICQGDSLLFGDQMLTEKGVYSRTFESSVGCDSTVNLELLINPKKSKFVSAFLCEGSTYDFMGENLTTPGIYTKTTTSKAGCDSTVFLNLKLSPVFEIFQEINLCAGSTYLFGDETLTRTGRYSKTFLSNTGCDSTVFLDLAISSPINVFLDEMLCENEFYVFDGDTISTAGTFVKTFNSTGGCDSIVTLSTTLIPPIITEMEASVCMGEFYLFGDKILSESGTYDLVLTSEEGCDSTIHLNLTVTPDKFRNTISEICRGDTLDFHGQRIFKAGFYQAIIPSSEGCDSVITTKLVVLEGSKIEMEASICSGQTYLFDGQALDTSGVYTQTLESKNGCDSTIVLNLIVDDQIRQSITDTICNGGSYVFGEETLTRRGTYTKTFPSTGGCDSIVTLNLVVVDQFETRVEIGVCQGESYLFDDTELTRPGIYGRIFQSEMGCDSVVTVILSSIDPIEEELNVTLCQGDFVLFGDRNINEAGTYINIFESASGCDSVVTLNCTVVPQLFGRDEVTICEGSSYVFGTDTLTASGDYLYTYESIAECDSTVYLKLNVAPPITTELEVIMCAGESFNFNGQELTEPNVYTQSFSTETGCDSTVVLFLMQEGEEPARTIQDFNVCEPEAELTANLPEGTFGQWTSTSTGVTFANDQSPETLAMELQRGRNSFFWSLSTENCPNYSTDELQIAYASVKPVARNDFFGLNTDEVTFSESVVRNDNPNGMDWSTQLLSLPTAGTVSLFNDGGFDFFTNGAENIDVTFRYVLINEFCPEFRDTALVTLYLNADTREYPEVIGMTPNGDGVNDRFIIPELRVFSEDYADNELFIFNRWGDEIFYANPYDNNWAGTGKTGRTLPAGTYYYIAIFRTPERDIKKEGMILIIR